MTLKQVVTRHSSLSTFICFRVISSLYIILFITYLDNKINKINKKNEIMVWKEDISWETFVKVGQDLGDWADFWGL